jgi:hypothetical protein
MERAAGLLRHTSDERALAAAAAAGECGLILGMTEEQLRILEAARLGALDTLDPKDPDAPDHPVALQFLALSCESRYRSRDFAAAAKSLRLVNDRQKRTFGASARETVGTSIRLGATLFAVSDFVNSVGSLAEALETLEEADGPGSPSAADALPGLPPGRAGRDRLVASTHLAMRLRNLGAASRALGVLGPFLDAVPRLPPGREPAGAWPWPPELAGRALGVAGEAAADMGDDARGESLLRRSLDLLDPEPRDRFFLAAALEQLAGILGERGGTDNLRESADLREREAGILFSGKGTDSSDAMDALERAAACRDAAGDRAAALELHRKVLAGRDRLLGPADKSTRESRENVRRLERKLGGKEG